MYGANGNCEKINAGFINIRFRFFNAGVNRSFGLWLTIFRRVAGDIADFAFHRNAAGVCHGDNTTGQFDIDGKGFCGGIKHHTVATQSDCRLYGIQAATVIHMYSNRHAGPFGRVYDGSHQ